MRTRLRSGSDRDRGGHSCFRVSTSRATPLSSMLATTSSSSTLASVRLTGRKEDQKLYRHHSGYPGGLREDRAQDRAQPQRPSSDRRASRPWDASQDQVGQCHVSQAQGLRWAQTIRTWRSSPTQSTRCAKRGTGNSPNRDTRGAHGAALRDRATEDHRRPRCS